MMDRFDPRQFAVSSKNAGDPDADWMAVTVKQPAESFRQPKAREPYIPAIPRAFLRAAAQAGDALELLLVALAEMRIRGTTEIAIGPALWQKVGDPSKRVRTRLLRQIAALPASLCTLVPRTGRPHLLKAGPDWPRTAYHFRHKPLP